MLAKLNVLGIVRCTVFDHGGSTSGLRNHFVIPNIEFFGNLWDLWDLWMILDLKDTQSKHSLWLFGNFAG